MASEAQALMAIKILSDAVDKASDALEGKSGDGWDPPVTGKNEGSGEADAKSAAASSAEGQLTEHFNIKEFYCECGGLKCNGYNGLSKAQAMERTGPLAKLLEAGRAEINRLYPHPTKGKERAVSVMSGYRCKWANDRVGGAADSQHLAGRAADVSTAGVSTGAIWDRVNPNGGVGYGGGNFPHVDTRGYKSRWTY